MFFDCHVHSEMSEDSQMKLDDALEQAEKLEIGIILTEHFDYGMTYGGYYPLDCEAYFKNYSKYREQNVRLGVEIGLESKYINKNIALCEKYDFDFIIGSVHMIDEIDIYVDCLENQPPVITFEKYLEASIEMVQSRQIFHSLGHIDYISRYTTNPVKEVWYESHKVLYDELFKSLVETDRLMEISTKRIFGKESLKNQYKLCSRYRELGGKYVTIGSDAHDVAHIGNGFDLAVTLAHETGLRPVYFENGNMVENNYSDYSKYILAK